jgi:hypothetical protein
LTHQVLVTSGLSSFIETVPNALSIHAIKARSPPGTSLRDHFAALYIDGSAEFRTAQRNFVERCVCRYSLLADTALLLCDATSFLHSFPGLSAEKRAARSEGGGPASKTDEVSIIYGPHASSAP